MSPRSPTLSSTGYWMATGGVEAFLAVMPETVAGLARLELRTNEVHYEGDSVIRVMLSGAQLQPTSALAGR
jgi:hypothetical protein